MSGKGNWIVIGLLAAAAAGYAVYRMSSPGQPAVYLADRTTATGQDIATPLTAGAGVQKRGRNLVLYLVLTDANGKRVRGVRLPNGKTPPAPTVQILDADRNVVYSCTLKYG